MEHNDSLDTDRSVLDNDNNPGLLSKLDNILTSDNEQRLLASLSDNDTQSRIDIHSVNKQNQYDSIPVMQSNIVKNISTSYSNERRSNSRGSYSNDGSDNSLLTSYNSRRDNSRSSGSGSGPGSGPGSAPDICYSIRELTCNLRDAVVTISGQTILTSEDNIQSITTQSGNGFFIKGHYIICPADLVLINPNHKGIQRVSKILVDVSNVNGSGKAYSYEANIVGVDGAANIAILFIDVNLIWNRDNPPIRVCHPFLQWGKSRSSCPGDTIIMIGNISSPVSTSNFILSYPGAENAVVVGNISDNRYVFPNGTVPGELLLLSNVITPGLQRGLPVITKEGTIIGMLLHIYSATFTYNVALSEFFMRRPVKALIRSYQDNKIPNHYIGFVEDMTNYYRFNKAWLGISGILMGQEDYSTNLVNTGSEYIRAPIIYSDHLMNGPRCKELVGYRITSLMTDSLRDIISVGDIITHINGCPLGDRKGQISPSLIMWRVCPGEMVTIEYKKQSEGFELVYQVKVRTESYTLSQDFPFYVFSPSELITALI